MNTLDTLERLTRAWPQAEREALARSFGIGHVALQYRGTGSMEGLEFLYPFLNDSDKGIRRSAIGSVAAIFHGAGVESLDKLAYVTDNRDLFVRDTSPVAIGHALAGTPVETAVEILRPSFAHRNNYIRAIGFQALGVACARTGGPGPLSVLRAGVEDANRFVASNAIRAVRDVFADTGCRDALDVLAPFVPYRPMPREDDEARRDHDFRWRRLARCSGPAASSMALVARSTPNQSSVKEILRAKLDPQDGSFEAQISQADSVRAWSLLLAGRPGEAAPPITDILKTPGDSHPVWWQRLPRKVAIWTFPGVFAGSGDEGIKTAISLVNSDEHATCRTGILALGVASRGTKHPAALETLLPLLSHGNGVIRNATCLALGLTAQGTGDDSLSEALEAAAAGNRGGPDTAYPLAVGLLFQGSGDERKAQALLELPGLGRRRLTRHAALGVGLIYQGTRSPRAVELLIPVLESPERGYACEALHLVDFDTAQLERVPFVTLPRCHGLSDGAGSARMFVLKHFVGNPPPHAGEQ